MKTELSIVSPTEKTDVEPASILPAVAAEIVALRKEAVEGRMESGIENAWRYAEDAYNGQDEATENRVKMYKPASPDSAFIAVGPTEWSRSVAFLNITRPYVDTSAARVSDMLFPTDARNWEMELTPKQDVEEMLALLDQVPEEQVEVFAQMIQEELAQAELSIESAQKQIDDWLTEVNWNSALGRKIIMDSARIGTGVVKGPIPMDVGGKIQPGSKVVKAQNCFPDPACGDDIHDGEYFFEREILVPRKLRAKIKLESAGWLPASIIACLEEGPKNYTGTVLQENGKPKKAFELWYYQGEVSLAAMLECGCSAPKDAQTKVWANITMCNNYIVRVSISPLQNRFTYNVLCWQRRDDFWAGIGVGEQLETPQRGVNAGIRNLFDNAALSALPQIIFWRGVIHPMNGRFELEPGKKWQVADDEQTINDVKNAIMTIEIPSRQDELMSIISLMRDLAQETTGLPLIIQGQGSTGAVGSDQLQTNAASTVLRRLAKEFDSSITIPHITAYYDWIKEFEVLPVSEGRVKARGSSVLVERDIQAQALIQMVQLAKDPAYGIDPKLVMEEWLKSQKLDPEIVKLSPEREQQLMEVMSQPDEKAQAQIQSAQLRSEALTKQTEVEAETDRLKAQLQQESADRDRQHDKVMLDLEYRYKLVAYAMERNIDIGTANEEMSQIQTPAEEAIGGTA